MIRRILNSNRDNDDNNKKAKSEEEEKGEQATTTITTTTATTTAEEIYEEAEELPVEEAEELTKKELEEAILQRKLELERIRGEEWIPKTKLGRLVYEGKVRTMHEALHSGLPLLEPEIVDLLLPNLKDDVLNVRMVQRVTDSGRRTRFSITAVVGNLDGYVGVGCDEAKEMVPAIQKALNRSKLNIVEVYRGCGSWECGCGGSHSIPFAVKGKAGSVEIFLKPAPRGVGIVAGKKAKRVLELAGIQDVWITTRGKTRTTINYAFATHNALFNLALVKIPPSKLKSLRVIAGTSSSGSSS